MKMVDKISFKYFLDNMVKENSKTYWCIHNGYRYGEKMYFDRIEFTFFDLKSKKEIVCSNEDVNGNLRINSIKEAYLQFIEKACNYSDEIRRNFIASNNSKKYKLYTKQDYMQMTSANIRATRVKESRTIAINNVEYYVAQNLKIGEFIKVCCESVPKEMQEEYFIKLYENKKDNNMEEQEIEQIVAENIILNIEINSDKGNRCKDAKKISQKSVVQKIDFNRINKERKRLGDIGEDIVYQYEYNKLLESGNKKLAERVELVSRTQGDGLGYDIISYTCDGKEVFIEVKTTKQNKKDDFYISKNEINVSRQYSDKYKLYRIYALKLIEGTANLKIYEGALDEKNSKIQLEPVSYKVKLT